MYQEYIGLRLLASPQNLIMSSPLRSMFYTFGMVLSAEAGTAAFHKDLWITVPCIFVAWLMFWYKNKFR